MQLIQTNKILKKMIDHFDKKIPDTMKFFETREFIRLIKINVKQKWRKHRKIFATKKQVENALDRRKKLRENNKTFQRFI